MQQIVQNEVTLDKINISCIEQIPQTLVWPTYQQAGNPTGLQPPHLLLPPLQQSLQPPPLALLGSDYLTASTTLHQVRVLPTKHGSIESNPSFSPTCSTHQHTAPAWWLWLPTQNVQNAPNRRPPCRCPCHAMPWSRSKTTWTVTIKTTTNRHRCLNTRRRCKQRQSQPQFKHRTTSAVICSTSTLGWFKSHRSRRTRHRQSRRWWNQPSVVIRCRHPRSS